MKQLLEEELRQEKRMREYEQCRVEMTNSLLSKYVSLFNNYGFVSSAFKIPVRNQLIIAGNLSQAAFSSLQ